jgi:competence protein ComGC
MKNQKGITLVALVITIIVMLILVAVTVTLAQQNGGIFDTARKAANETNKAAESDQKLANDTMEYTVNGTTYTTNAEHIADGTYVNDANTTTTTNP